MADFILGSSQITADGDCSHEIKRHLLHGPSLTLGLGRFPGEGNGNPLQCSCLENARDGAGHTAAGSPVAGRAAQVQRALRGELRPAGTLAEA